MCYSLRLRLAMDDDLRRPVTDTKPMAPDPAALHSGSFLGLELGSTSVFYLFLELRRRSRNQQGTRNKEPKRAGV